MGTIIVLISAFYQAYQSINVSGTAQVSATSGMEYEGAVGETGDVGSALMIGWVESDRLGNPTEVR